MSFNSTGDCEPSRGLFVFLKHSYSEKGFVLYPTHMGGGTTVAAQRVVLTFDANSIESLKQLQERGEFSSIGTAVREAVQLSEVLQEQVDDGFTDVVLRNPKTNQEKTLVIPSLRRLAKKAAKNS
jgi:hypothetical protein